MKFLRLAAIGAALAYFLDPQQGARRRNMTRDRVLAFFRRRGRGVAGAGRAVAAEAYGLKQKATHLREEPKSFDDQTLKAKVESEVFRPADAPKGEVSVNVEEGVVYLRGQLDDPSLIEGLEQRVRSVRGVDRVENLLHTPGTEAPTHS
jgi:osmotically-inducible protein OsmY